ncbi:MAG: DUF6089 family protein [Paludibacter sp.]|jgi:hypothetical protein|nr:DUF6089 family protein [Paludibacter sp.]
MTRFLKVSLILSVFFPVSMFAQMIYTTEAGIYGGASYFSGDVSKNALEGMKGDVGLTLRYVFNQRISLHADYHQTRANGEFTSLYPAVYSETLEVNNPLRFLDVTMAFNFFDYGYLEHIMYSSNITPYLFAGIGGVLLPAEATGKVSATLPYGIGIKVRLSPRLHLNAQWTQRLMLGSDRVEGRDEANNPLQLNGSNRFNNDGSGSLSIGISIGLTQRDCECQNYQ